MTFSNQQVFLTEHNTCAMKIKKTDAYLDDASATLTEGVGDMPLDSSAVWTKLFILTIPDIPIESDMKRIQRKI